MDADKLREYLSQQEPSPWPIPFSVISRRTNIPSGCTDENDRAERFGRVLKNVKGKNCVEMRWRTDKVDMWFFWWILKYDGDDEKDKKQGTDLRLHQSDLMFNVAGHGGRRRATTK
jgi:hypothetical protein